MEASFISQMLINIEKIKKNSLLNVFTIATTSKEEEQSYLTPVRLFKDFGVTGCVIFEQNVLYSILAEIDGLVDIILVDTEKKIPLRVSENFCDIHENFSKPETVGYIETGNLSKICFENIKYSKIYEFKPNDLTVNAAWTFLSHKLKFLSGKKISILGAGNIGSKLALKLVECGANVHIFRKNIYKGHVIEQGLNFIKPGNTVANIVFQESALNATFMSDAVVGASNGFQVIDKNIINSLKKRCIVVDLGKNNLSEDAIALALENRMEICRLDVTSALEGFIYEVLGMENILKYSYGKKNLEFCQIVSGGYFGDFGDVVVDNINNPSKIYGVSAGNGLLKKKLTNIDEMVISKIKETFGID